MRGSVGPAMKKGGPIKPSKPNPFSKQKPSGPGMKAGGMVRGKGDGCVSKGRTRG